ncbi:potassium channel [Plasmodium gonderi]|uniref:Potassium channel n=1 Tax=Plasmodium gonderi TaxID=77519 RepID=A0A1Y1JJL1_PLAGO|nr:potassium channel [Plasmodium gonderi]GAW82430.1 potassium channel [Plasmodium gonderi]
MKSGLLSINDVFFLVVNIFKYFLIVLNGLYLCKLPFIAGENVDFVSCIVCIIVGFSIKLSVIVIYYLYFMDIYAVNKCRRKSFLNLFHLNNTDGNGNRTMQESDDFEYKKLIKKFFFKKVYYSIKKKHKKVELYMLKIYNSTFNYYFCNIRDTLYALIWYISLYYWRRDTYDTIWNFDKIPAYIYNILIVLLSSSYIDLVMVILSYNKSKFYMMKSKLLIDIFFSAPNVFFFSKYLFVLDNKIDIYFIMGFLRNIKIFLNVSYVRIEQNSILTNTEIKIVRIVFGVLLLCNAFASTIYTIQAIHPFNLKDGNFRYFLNSYLDYFYFSIISISTVGYGDILPINKLSKVVCIIFIFWTFIWVPIQFNDLIISIFSKKKTYGKVSRNNQKFILLIGEVEPQKLNVFLFESIAYGNKLKFHILTTYPISFYKEQIKVADHFCISLYIKNFDLNDKQNTNLLYSINAQNAYYLFLFSDKFNNGHYNIDTKSFTRLLILKKFLHGKKNAVIELRNKSVSNIVKSIGCENFVIVNLKHSLIVKNAKYPGIITLILNLFTAYKYDANFLYTFDDKHSSFPLKKYISEYSRGSRTKIFSFLAHKNMIGLKFDKLFYKLYLSLGIILIGIENDNENIFLTERNSLTHNVIKLIKGRKKRHQEFKFIYLHLLKRYSHMCTTYVPSSLHKSRNTSNRCKNCHMKQENLNTHTTKKFDLLNVHKKYHFNKKNLYNSGDVKCKNLMCKTGYCREGEYADKSYKGNKINGNIPHRRKKNNSSNMESKDNICISIDRSNTTNNKVHQSYSIRGNKYIEDLKNWDYNIIHTITNTKWGRNSYIHRNNKQLKSYLNLLGKNYAIQENDKCIVIANSKKVIKYLSIAKSLYWLFEIKSKKKENIPYDLKSVIKTKQTFNKYFTANVRRNISNMPHGYNTSLIQKNANIMAVNYHDLFRNYKISRLFFSKKSYLLGKKNRKVIYEHGNDKHDSTGFKVPSRNNSSIGIHQGSAKQYKNCEKWEYFQKTPHDIICDTKNCTFESCNFSSCITNEFNIDTELGKDDKKDHVTTTLHYLESPHGNISLRNGPQNSHTLPSNELCTHGNSMNKYSKGEKKCREFLTSNCKDKKLLHLDHSQIIKKHRNYFYHKNKLKKKKYLNNYCNFQKSEETLKEKDKQNNFNSTFKMNAIVYSYVEAYEKYFSQRKNNKLLLIINCPSNIIDLIKMINRKYGYNIIILTDEIPTINIHDLCKYNVVFIKCKSLDDYNILNAGLIQAYYILILPTEANNVDEINEIDMNNIILTRKIIHLMRKKKKSYYINNIMTELINPSNTIFLEENKMVKLKDKKSSYSDFFPYVNCSRFYSSNIICETMLYNFMTHHKSFTKFSVCNDTLKSLIKHISTIYICDLNKYFDFSFKKIKTFRDLFYYLSKKNIITIGLYRRGDKYAPFYIYTKPHENCVLKLDDIIYVL